MLPLLCPGCDGCLRTLSPWVTVLWNLEQKPIRPLEPGNGEESSGSSHKSQDTRQGYKLFSGRYWRAGVRPRESAKTVSPGLCSLRALPGASGSVPNQKSPCPWGWSSWTSSQASFSERLELCFSVLSVQYPEGGHPLRTISWIVNSPVGPRNTSLPGLQSWAIKGRILHSISKTRVTRCKIRAPDVCKHSPPEDTGALEWGRWRVQRCHPLGGKKFKRKERKMGFTGFYRQRESAEDGTHLLKRKDGTARNKTGSAYPLQWGRESAGGWHH